MLKKHKWTLLTGTVVTLLPILAGLLLWDRLPEQIPTHWGPTGEVDGWSSKAFAVIGLPVIVLVLHWICVFATYLDPKNKNQHQKPMTLVLWICPVITVLLSTLTLGSALGWQPDVSMIMPVLMGILFLVIGNYLPKCTHNYTIGIKISWTLNSEENWNATHRFAGKVWFAGGFAMMLCGLLPGIWMALGVCVVTLILVVIPIVFSWRFYQKEKTE